MPYATTNGVRLYYEVSGEGTPIVFVHANPFDHRLWMYQVAEFSSYYRCISVDIRGYGRSDKPQSPFTLADMKDDVLGVCRQEGVTCAIYCGCSVGSGIALMIGLDHPEMALATILVGGNSRGSANVQKRAEGFSTTKDLKGFLDSYIRELVAPGFDETPRGEFLLGLFTANAHTLSGPSIANIHRARGAATMTDRLAGMEVPTLVINGAHDNSLAAGTETAMLTPGARHVVIPDTGHACPIEDPDAFNQAVITFLKDKGLWQGTSIP
jgi:pimeloyl-ACP methyl ester carboxylesterase